MTKLARKIFAVTSRAGITLIPLAVFTSSAWAVAILPSSSFQVTSQNVFSTPGREHAPYSVSLESLFVQGGPVVNGVQGLALSGFPVFTCLGQGPLSCDGSSVTFQVSGGIKGDLIPPGAGLSIYALSIDDSFNWSLLGSSGTALFSEGQQAAVLDQDFILPIGADGSWSFALTITPLGEYEGGSTFELRIPGAETIDIYAANAATPEPASILLGAGGGAFLFLRRRRRA